MNSSQFKRGYEQATGDTSLFSRIRMAMTGDTMINYGVRTVEYNNVEAYELYRRRPVRWGLRVSIYFDRKTYERI